MKNKLLAAALLLLSAYAGAQVTLTVYDDCNRNGHLVDLTDKSSGKAVDLGLSVRWASCNIGATAPEEVGDEFMWGETEVNERGTNSWKYYKYSYNSDGTLTKYCTQEEYGTVDGKYILESRDDAATVNWGSDWRTPTPEEYEELFKHCYKDQIEINKIKCVKFTSKINGNYIIFPYNYSSYWTNILSPTQYEGEYNDPRARYADLYWGDIRSEYRYRSYPVRAVRE